MRHVSVKCLSFFFINFFFLIFRTTEPGASVEFYKPNVELTAIVELSYYSNAVLSAFILESVVSCAVIYCCDLSLDNIPGHMTCPATRDEILATAVEICQLLQYEFIFVSVSHLV